MLQVRPVKWPHRSQYFASSASEHHFRETVVVAQSCTVDKRTFDHTLEQVVPTFCVVHTAVLERLPLPLLIIEACCECGAGQAPCPLSGRLRTRAVPTEGTLARFVRCNAKLKEMNIAVSVSDERSIKVLASGLPAHHGAQLVVDITLRSALHRDRRPLEYEEALGFIEMFAGLSARCFTVPDYAFLA